LVAGCHSHCSKKGRLWDLSGDGFAGLVDVKMDNGEGPYEVRVLKKWTLSDYCSSGKAGDVSMVLIDKNVRFFN
jgi:hypothetical protein